MDTLTSLHEIEHDAQNLACLRPLRAAIVIVDATFQAADGSLGLALLMCLEFGLFAQVDDRPGTRGSASSG